MQINSDPEDTNQRKLSNTPNFTVVRSVRDKDHPFVILNKNFLSNKKLSLKAKGFLTLVFSLPDTWEFTIEGMRTITGEGKNTIYKIINELVENGYCKKKQSNKGKFSKVYYFFFEVPYSKESVPLPKNRETDSEPVPKNREADRSRVNREEKSINEGFIPLPNFPQAVKGSQISNNSNKEYNVEAAAERIKDFFNKNKFENYPECSLLTKDRIKLIQHLIQNHEFSENKIISVLEKANKSEWMQKQSFVTFDWILNETNFVKISEGKYDEVYLVNNQNQRNRKGSDDSKLTFEIRNDY